MLKRIYIKKIIVCFVALFAILLLYIIPNKEEKFSIKEELNYVEEVSTSTIYLLDSNNLLAHTKIMTENDEIEKKAKELLESLIIGGSKQDLIPNGFKAVIPNDTEILSITYKDNVIKVNFSSELFNTSKEMEEKIVEAIVYTLTSIKDVKYVIIYVDNNILTTLPKSNKKLPSTLDRSFGINKEYNLDSTKDINKTTIYYISKYNDNEYYVPVTKINNDTRSKIEIIIDELSSNNSYNNSLMSYLNSNTTIISSSQTDDILSINFNNAIFNDINTKEILEEVIYTISMSINDNYDVDTVIFNVDDEEIYKSVLKSIE